MDINVQELSSLLSEERFKSNEESRSQLAASVPLIYRSMLSAPAITGMPLPDAAINMVAPIIGSAMGMPNTRIMPQISQGMSPFEATYIANMNDQYVKNSREAFNFDMGGNLGGSFAQMANNLGFSRLLNMAPQQMNESMVGFGQSQVGRFLAEQMMRTSPGQAIMGGDPWAMQSNMFANRMAFGVTPGSVVMPMDMGGQMGIAQSTQMLTSELGRAIYPNGITPNANFTRGFKPEEIGDIATMMAQRGANTIGDMGEVVPQGMRGADIDPRRKVQAIGEMTRVLESVRDLMGGGDVQQLMSTLESLTQMRWPSINRPALEQTFREMSANAHILGVSGQNMLEGTMQTQNVLRSIYGIGPQQAQLGMTAGGYTGYDASAQLYTTNLAISAATGKPIGQVVAQQSAMMEMAANSPRGRDMTQIAYYAQEGLISPEAFDRFRTISMTGDPDRANYEAQRLLSSAGGSRAISNNDMMMAQIRKHTSEPMAQIVNEMLINAPGAEFAYRVGQELDRGRSATLSSMESLTGVPGLGLAERATARYTGAMEYLNSAAAGPNGAVMAGVVAQAYGSDADPVRGMRAADRAMQTAIFSEHRTTIERYMGKAVDEARITHVTDPLARNLVTMRGGMEALRGVLPENDKRVTDLYHELTTYSTAVTTGKATPDMATALAAHYGEVVSGLSPEQKAAVAFAGARGGTTFDNYARKLVGQVHALGMIENGRGNGLDSVEIINEAAALTKLSYIRPEERVYGAAMLEHGMFKTLSGDTAKAYANALRAGPGSKEFTDFATDVRATAIQFGLSSFGVAAGRTSGMDAGEVAHDATTAKGITTMLKNLGGPEAGYEKLANEAAEPYRNSVMQRLVETAVDRDKWAEKANVRHAAVQSRTSQGGGGDKQSSPTKLSLSGRLVLVNNAGVTVALADTSTKTGALEGLLGYA